MKYQKYIDLGFDRQDLNDLVRFKECGYSGFSLFINLNHKLSISVSDCELDYPKLYVKGNLIMEINQPQVEELIRRFKQKTPFPIVG